MIVCCSTARPPSGNNDGSFQVLSVLSFLLFLHLLIQTSKTTSDDNQPDYKAIGRVIKSKCHSSIK